MKKYRQRGRIASHYGFYLSHGHWSRYSLRPGLLHKPLPRAVPLRVEPYSTNILCCPSSLSGRCYPRVAAGRFFFPLFKFLSSRAFRARRLASSFVCLCGIVCGGLAAGRIFEGYLPLSRMEVNSLVTLCFVYMLLLPCNFFSTSLYLQTRLNGLGASIEWCRIRVA